MNVCSLPECPAEAVLQWTRTATPDERAVHAEQRYAVRLGLANEQRDGIQQSIEEAGLLLADLRRTPGDQTISKLMLQRNIDAMRRELAEIRDPAAVAVDPDLTIAVFGCPDHAVDPDSATGIHESHCLSAAVCDCEPLELPQ